MLRNSLSASKPRIRRKECPAFATKCNHCDKDHHFERMCRSRHGTKPAKDVERYIRLALPATDNTKRASMDHHVFDKAWLRRRSRSQPYIRLQVTVQREDYDHFGFPSKCYSRASDNGPSDKRTASLHRTTVVCI